MHLRHQQLTVLGCVLEPDVRDMAAAIAGHVLSVTADDGVPGRNACLACASAVQTSPPGIWLCGANVRAQGVVMVQDGYVHSPSAVDKVLAFKTAFWKFLRPHTIRGTILGATAVTSRALLENQQVPYPFPLLICVATQLRAQPHC